MSNVWSGGSRTEITTTPTQVNIDSLGPLYNDLGNNFDYASIGLSRGIIRMRAAGRSNNTGKVLLLDDAGVLIRSKFSATTEARIEARSGEVSIGYTGSSGIRSVVMNNAGVWARTVQSGTTMNVSLIPQVRQFQYSPLWNADQSPAHIMVQHLPGGKLCQAQIRIQNLSGSSLSLPYDTWVTLNYNPIPSDLRGGYTDYIEVTLPQLNARGRVEMNYSTGSIRVKSLEKGATISWTNTNSIWFPMRWFSPD